MINVMTKHNPQLRQQELEKRKRLQRIAKIKRAIGYTLMLIVFIGYTLMLIVFAGYVYIILAVAANMEAVDTEKWAKNFLISFAQDLGVGQIFKVFLTVVIMRIMPKSKNAKLKRILRFLMDPITMRAVAFYAIK